MRLLAILLLVGAQAFPSRDRTSWMQPDAFRLRLGMEKSAVASQLEGSGWSTREGKEPNHLIVEYDENRTITLMFEGERLDSIRFELVDFIPQLQQAFDEQRESLQKRLGEPDRTTDDILMYEKTDPNVFVVKSARPDSSFGRQGVGFLTVRYFTPAPPAPPP